MMQNAAKITYTNFRVNVRVDENVACLSSVMYQHYAHQLTNNATP